MCPIIGEIQMYELSNKTYKVNQTFNEHSKYFYNLFKSKNLVLPPEETALTIEDYKAMIDEILMNYLEVRYLPNNA